MLFGEKKIMKNNKLGLVYGIFSNTHTLFNRGSIARCGTEQFRKFGRKKTNFTPLRFLSSDPMRKISRYIHENDCSEILARLCTCL